VVVRSHRVLSLVQGASITSQTRYVRLYAT
jgi:hypothetical protein